MASPLVIKTELGGVVRLTLNRPDKRNALSREVLQELLTTLRDLSTRTDVRLVVLSAEGTVFCAGMDLAQMQENAARPDATALWQADTALYRDVVTTLLQLRTPTLAVLPGPALAGGLGLVLACDLVLAAETSTLALPEPKRGLTAAIVTPLLAYRAGPSAASFLLLSGQSISADHARHAGICHAVVPAMELSAKSDELVASILTGAPGALAASKRHLLECAGADLLTQIDQAVALSARARETAEAREGLQAFLEKRSPTWAL